MRAKVNILFGLNSGPTGGGNQFLKAVKRYFIKQSVYADNPAEADVIMFNSYQFIHNVAQLKREYPDKVFVHRVDGPLRLYNSMKDKRDGIVNTTNRLIADATIFQSVYSRESNRLLGLAENHLEAIIVNAPDPQVFHPVKKKKPRGKTNLIAVSWSDNVNKGFDHYRWLDENLDFGKYSMLFVGRSPYSFKNIEVRPPLPSNEIASALWKADVFVTASKKDPCSNSLIEAMHCGLPVLALNDGGHPEIVGKAGELYENIEDVPTILDEMVEHYESYGKAFALPLLDEVGRKYYEFLNDTCSSVAGKTKSFGLAEYMQVMWSLFRWKFNVKFRI